MPARRPAFVFVLLTTWFLSGFAASGVRAESARMLLKEGRYQEETVRDLDAAITAYKQVREQTNSDPRSLAESDLAVARCLFRKGKHSEARQRLKIVIREFPHFAGIITEAQSLLQRMPAADPAAFMPADTLIYAELTQPWAHMERVVRLLAEADVGRLFKSHLEGHPNFPLEAFFNQLTVHQLAEIQKIEALAIGIVDFAMSRTDGSDHPFNEFIIVLFPGQSGLVRSLITNMSASMPKIDRRFECDIFEVPGTRGRIHLAVGEDVFLLGSPLKTVIEALARRRADERNSLADNEDFRRQAAARRQDSVIITYGNLSRLVPIIRNLEDRGNFDNLNAVLDLDTVDYLMARVDLDDDQMVIEATALFNEDRPNAFYEFWKSAKLDLGACRYIPSDAIAALSVAVEDGRRKWEQLFDIAGTIYEARDDSARQGDPIEIIQALETVLDSEKGRRLLASLRSLTFVLTKLDATGQPGIRGVLENLVLVGNTGNTETIEQTFGTIADALARGVQGDPGAVAKKQPLSIGEAVGTRYHLSENGSTWSVVQQGGIILASSSEAGIRKCLDARELGKSILDLDLGHPLRQMSKNAHKYGFIRVDRVLQRLAEQNRIQLPVQDDAMPIVFSTIEKPRELIIRIQVNDLSKVIRGLTEVTLLRFNRAATESPANLQPATVSVEGRP